MFQLEHADRFGARVHFPVEIRFSASDDIWLSPSYGQKTTWIGIIQYKSVSLCHPQSVGVSVCLFSLYADPLLLPLIQAVWA